MTGFVSDLLEKDSLEIGLKVVCFGILIYVMQLICRGGNRVKKTLLAMMFGAVLVLGACGGGGDKADKPKDDGETSSVDAGEAVYNKSCVTCHAGNLEGVKSHSLAKIGATKSAEEIKEIAMNGQGGMPAVLKDNEADAEAVAKWLAEKK